MTSTVGSAIPQVWRGTKRVAAKKMSMKTAMKKYETSAEDKRKDRAGANKIMAKANKGRK